MTTVDLSKIAVFARVVEAQSFTAAAEALGLPKSSVSRGVARLEEELGVRLLQRTTRRLGLTEAGRVFYERVRAALSTLDEAATEVSDLGSEPRGTVRLTAPVDLGPFLAEPLTRFTRKHPQVGLDLVLTPRIVDLVREGFDLALRASRLLDSSLVARKIGGFADGLVAAPAYLKRRPAPRTLADLAAHECLIFRGRTTWGLRGPGGDEQVEVRGSLNADDLSFLIQAAEAGAGVAFLPLFLCVNALADRRLVRVLPGYDFAHVDLSLVMPSGRYVPARVALLRDFLAAEFKALVASSVGL